MQAGGGLFFYGTTLYMSLSQPRLLVSVSSTVQNKYKKNRQSPSTRSFADALHPHVTKFKASMPPPGVSDSFQMSAKSIFFGYNYQ